VEEAAEPKDSAADQVESADAEEWESVVDVATCADSEGEGADMW
jgi:hypothetical protein